MDKTPYNFGVRCLKWALYTFGSTLVYNSQERCARFLEEALELVQALGFNKRRALALVEYVYGREPGEVDQEFGGVMNTLYLLGETGGRNLHELGERELSRCWDNVEKIREKNLLKNKDYLNDTIRGVPVEQPSPDVAALVEALREANGILEDALQEVGDDYPGSNCQAWCQQQVKEARAAIARVIGDEP